MPVGLRRLGVVLVVEGDVVVDVLALDVHALDPVAHDRGELVGEGRVVAADDRHRRRQDVAVAVVVLQALAGQRGAPGRRAHEEAATTGIPECPHLVAGPLEAEHRVEDVERDHRVAVGGIRGPGRLEAGHRARLGDALLEDLAVGRLAVRQHEIGVDRLVALPEGGVDADLLEQRVHAERARLVGDDRDDARPELLVADQVAQDPREDHGRRDLGLAAGRELLVHLGCGRGQRPGADDALRDGATERCAALAQVLDLLRLGARVVVRGFLELLVRDRQLQPVRGRSAAPSPTASWPGG